MTEQPGRRATVAVVGGGFSGAVVAIHLLREAGAAVEVVLVEPAAEAGRGLAYSTPSDSHRLNVPAGRLGVDAAHEAGFVDWLRAQGLPHGAGDFVARRWLGRYVASELDRAAAQARAGWRRVPGRAEGVRRVAPSRFEIRLAGGEALAADRVVLATGHLPTVPPAFAGTAAWGAENMIADPWRDNGLSILPASRDVLLVGAGLTAVDVFSQLRDDGHRGRIHLLSRRGLMPQPHRVNEARPPAWLSPVDELGDAVTLRRLTAAVRDWAGASRVAGNDWRDVMAGLRSCTPQLWQRLAADDRRRFLRHLQPFWDTHRHRLAPAIHERVQAAIAGGDLQPHAGRLVAIDRRDDGQLDVRWRARGAAAQSRLVVGRVINCTGPSASLARAATPLLAAMRDDGLLRADELDQGLVVDEALRLVDANGVPTAGLHYVGPLLKARFWEAIAVPELRVHARHVAQAILADLERVRAAPAVA